MNYGLLFFNYVNIYFQNFESYKNKIQNKNFIKLFHFKLFDFIKNESFDTFISYSGDFFVYR